MKDTLLSHLLVTTSTGYAINEIIRNGKEVPVGYRIIECNDKFRELIGLPVDISNRNIYDILKDFKESGLDSLEIYLQVTGSGKSVSFEKFSAYINRWFKIDVIPENENHFITFFSDITVRKQKIFNEEKLLGLTRSLLEADVNKLDYQQLTEVLCKMAGADYCIFNRYASDMKTFRNVAIYGESKYISKAYKYLGYSLQNKEWDISQIRLHEIQGGIPVRFENLSALAAGIMPEVLCSQISDVFNLGSLYVVEISSNGKTYGDFILVFSKGREMADLSAVSSFANLIGLTFERRYNEKRVRLSETNLNNFFNAGIDFNWVLDSAGNILTINDTVRKKLGYSDAELIGKSVLMVHPEDQRAEAARIIKSMLDGKDEKCFIPLQTKSGYSVPVETYVIQSTWNGEPVLFGISKDLSELKLSEEKFSKAFNTSPNIMGISDLETGTFFEVNQSFCDLLGYTREEVFGKKSSEVIRFDEEQRREFHKTLLREGSIRNAETVVFTKSGKPVTVQLSAQIIHIQDKQYNLTVAVDISERSRAEEELRRANQLLEQSGLMSKTGAWEVDVEKNTLFWSDVTKQIAGLPKDYIPDINRVDEFYLEGENREKILRLVQRAIQYGEPFDDEFQIRILDGSVRWIRNIARPWFKNGRCIRLIGTFQDITDRKASEEILRVNERKYRLLYENMSQGVMFYSSGGDIIDANPAAEKILGYTLQELKCKSIFDPDWKSVKEDGTPLTDDERPVAIAIRTGKPSPPTLMGVFNKKEGKYKWLLSNAIPEYSQDGSELFQVFSTFIDLTYRKEADDKIRQSELKYRELQGLFRNMADIIPDMLWAKDTKGDYLFANNSLCKNLLGARDTNEPIGKNDLYFSSREQDSHPGDPEWHTFGENCCDSDAEVIKSGDTKQFDEYGNVRGKFLFLDVIKTPLMDHNGKITGVVGTARDVTESRKASLKLQESEANLKALIENTQENIWSVNTEYEIQYVNEVFVKAFMSTFGIELAKGINVLHCLPEGMRKLWKDRYDRAFTGEKMIFEDCIQISDQVIYIEVAINPILLDKKVVGASLFGKDVTEKKTGHIQLQYQADIREILVGLSSGFINVPIREINPAINNSLVRIGEFIGADRVYIVAYDLVSNTCSTTYEWCKPEIDPKIGVIKNISIDKDTEWLQMHKKGEMVGSGYISEPTLESLKTTIRRTDTRSILTIPLIIDNMCAGFVGFDSVNHRQIFSSNEIQLLQVYAQALVNMMERIDKEKRLIGAKEKAEESDRLKSAFLANMSHEIRTPMSGILGFLELLKEQDLSNEIKESYINIVTQSGTRLLNTINDIIEISKIEAGEQKLKLSVVNVSELMGYLYDFFKPQTDDKGLDLKISDGIGDNSYSIFTDRLKLEGILSNLLKNAIKFTSKGFVELGTRLEGSCVVFFVRDTGTGIRQDRINAIFDRFVQADVSSSRPHEGSGLGLSIVKAYVDLLGGDIRVDSSPGSGSTFFVSIPILKTSIKDEHPHGLLSEAISFPKGKTILVVEDDYANYLYMEKLLTSAGFIVMHTVTGTETVKVVRENPGIALVLMDIKIPEISGIEATRLIREFNPGIPIIAQSAYAFPRDREAAMQAGVNDYLTKPIIRKNLLNAIGKYIGLRK